MSTTDQDDTETQMDEQGAPVDPRLPILTPEQEKTVLANWDKVKINALVKMTFANKDLDGRTFEGKAIKLFLAKHGCVAGTTEKPFVGELYLTPEQKKFIEENGKDGGMKPLEMKQVLFPNDKKGTLLSREGRAVYKYAKAVHGEDVDFWDEPVDTQKYNPPKTVPETKNLVNSYVSNATDPSKEAYSTGSLRPFEEKCLKALQGYLKTIRFRYQAAQYDKRADRALFESSFVRTTHDKPDLSAADVDMYVAGAAEMVNVTREERKILKLEDKLNDIMEEDTGENGERKPLTQAFVELLNQTRTKWDASKKRYQDIMGALESTRAKRNEHQIQRSQSVLNLLEAWQKDEETRNDIIAFGEKEKAEDAAEVKRLADMDGVIALIAGMTVKEGSS